jgi:hypothetical protein
LTDDISLADLLKNPSMTTSQKSTDLIGGELLPDHPKKSRVFAQKRKATVISVDDNEPSRQVFPNHYKYIFDFFLIWFLNTLPFYLFL